MSARDNDKDMLGRKFEAFFLLYFPKVKDVAMKFLKSECEAEDIAQDIFVKLWSKPHLWNNDDDTRPIDGYLFSTTRNHYSISQQNRKNPQFVGKTFPDAIHVSGSTARALFVKNNLLARCAIALLRLFVGR